MVGIHEDHPNHQVSAAYKKIWLCLLSERRYRLTAECDNTPLVKQRNVLLRFKIEPAEVALTERAVTEVVKLRNVVSAGARTGRVIPVVVLHESACAEEIGMRFDARNAVNLLRRYEATIVAGTNVVKYVTGGCTCSKLWHYFETYRSINRRVLVAIGTAACVFRAGPRTVVIQARVVMMHSIKVDSYTITEKPGSWRCRSCL